jgi:hypothetical protein
MPKKEALEGIAGLRPRHRKVQPSFRPVDTAVIRRNSFGLNREHQGVRHAGSQAEAIPALDARGTGRLAAAGRIELK